MIENNLPLKYITGSYKYDPVYPTKFDLLFELVNTGKKTINIDDIDWIMSDIRNVLLNELVESGHIKINNNKLTIVKTFWDGWCNE